MFIADWHGAIALDAATGAVLWELPEQVMGGSVDGIALDEELLWIGQRGRLQARAASTGQLVTEVTLCGSNVLMSTPAITRSHVLAACGGKLFGVYRATYQFSELGSADGALAIDDGRVYSVKGWDTSVEVVALRLTR